MFLVKIIRPKLSSTRLRTIEVIAQSEKSWAEAARTAFEGLSETIRNLQILSAKGQEGGRHNQKSTLFRVTAKASFILEKD